MKKLFLILVLFSCYQLKANAQDKISKEPSNQQKPSRNYSEEERKRQFPKPNFTEINPANLSAENKELLKKEQELHRQNFKNITGVDLIISEDQKNLSPDQHQKRGENIRSTMQNLPKNKIVELRQEMQRHRNQLKNITGVDLVSPNDNKNNDFNNPQQRNCQTHTQEQLKQHRQAMESLPADKKALVKKEMDRHRQQMKDITGLDLPHPNCKD